MKSVVFLLIAIFSIHAHSQLMYPALVTPETQYEEIQYLRVEKMKDGNFLVDLAESDFPGKHVWLITCSSELVDGLKDFNAYFKKGGYRDRTIELNATPGVSPLPLCKKEDKPSENGFFQIILSEESMRRSYIYIDYLVAPCFANGYYYSIDLPAYLRQINTSEN